MKKKRFIDDQTIGFVKQAHPEYGRGGARPIDLATPRSTSDVGDMAARRERRSTIEGWRPRRQAQKLLAEAVLDTEALRLVIRVKRLSPQARQEAAEAMRTKTGPQSGGRVSGLLVALDAALHTPRGLVQRLTAVPDPTAGGATTALWVSADPCSATAFYSHAAFAQLKT